ncbi:MAG: hypothetical protein ACXAB4_06095 [Candidatus Hodarchaeales archaeon]|jgi:hypothetical protein
MASKSSGSKRSEQAIAKQVDKVQQTYNTRMNLVTKALGRRSRKKMLILLLIVSFSFYILAIVGAMADFGDAATDATGTNGTDSNEEVPMEISGWNFTTERLKYFTDLSDPTKDSESIYAGYGRELLFMPILIFVHLLMLAVIGKSMREPLVRVPRLIDMDTDKLVKTVKKVRGNFGGLIVALPFMVFDAYWSYQDVSDPDEVIINPLVHWIVTASWTLQWFIFGVVLYSLVRYLLFIRHLTKDYQYEGNILAIVVGRDLDPLIYLGYQLAGVLGLYLITNLAYMWLVPPPWYSDVLATAIVLFALPIMAIGPLEMIERDIASEQAVIRARFFDQYITEGIKFISNPGSVNERALLEVLMSQRLLETFSEHKGETLKVYFRVFYVMLLAVGGILLNVIYVASSLGYI